MNLNKPSSNNPPYGELPIELRGWNWGAFLLNWVWGIGNSTYIALLMFIPGVNLIVPFVLGMKGNEWAWKNTRWENHEHFRTVQKLWARVGIIAYLGTAIFVAVIFFGLMHTFKSSEPYKMSLELVRNDSRIEQAIGSPLEESGWMIHGNLLYKNSAIDGSEGEAAYTYTVSGPEGDGNVALDAVLKQGIWDLKHLTVTTKYEKITIIDQYR